MSLNPILPLYDTILRRSKILFVFQESCSSESSENETEQNQTNQKSVHSLGREFDHLSVVTEETSADLSDRNSAGANSLPKDSTQWNILPPDDTYPTIGPSGPPQEHLHRIDENIPQIQEDLVQNIFKGLEEHLQAVREPSEISEDDVQNNKNPITTDAIQPKHFFAPWPQRNGFPKLQTCEKGPSDLIVKDTEFPNFPQEPRGKLIPIFMHIVSITTTKYTSYDYKS